MTLPSTGAISASDINVELRRPASSPLSFADPVIRQLAGKATGPVTFDDFKGKSAFYNATGGTITTFSENGKTYRVHTFTEGGTFEVTNQGALSDIEALLVAGGGGAVRNTADDNRGGGGGGGGVVDPRDLVLAVGQYPVVVGAGGPRGETNADRGEKGEDSTFAGVVAIGGGGGASRRGLRPGGDGGSGGGGGARRGTSNQGQGGAAQQPTSESGGLGFAGGPGSTGSSGGGGGGAGGAGGTPTGGPSVEINFDGVATLYAGGGSGATGGDPGTGGSTGTGPGGGHGGAPGRSRGGGPGRAGIVKIRYEVDE